MGVIQIDLSRGIGESCFSSLGLELEAQDRIVSVAAAITAEKRKVEDQIKALAARSGLSAPGSYELLLSAYLMGMYQSDRRTSALATVIGELIEELV